MRHPVESCVEAMSCRVHKGTLARLEALRPYIAATFKNRPVPGGSVPRSEVVRELIAFSLEVYERRQAAWERENETA
jgi:hypothetical protein